MEDLLIEKYITATNKLILLDYDGTLVDFEPFPDRAKPTSHLLEVLNALSQKSNTELRIITGRRHFDIDRFLGELPINIIAEHGALVKENGKWELQINDFGIWKNSVLPIFNRITSTCPNSFVEEKQYSLTWHYRNAEAESGYLHSRELIRALTSSARSNNLRIIDGKGIVEIMSNSIDKGKAVKNILKHRKYDFILFIGDDQTDEDLFRELVNVQNAFTIKVGPGISLAKYRLNSVSEVLSFLKELI